MSPMPREPPVTRATLPSMEKRFDIGGTMPRRRAEGKGRSPGRPARAPLKVRRRARAAAGRGGGRMAVGASKEDACHPRLPTLRNTDGDPLVPTTLRFDLRCAPGEAFARLKSLALDASDEELLADAERDAAGQLRAVRLTWLERGNPLHESGENTVLGTVAIDGPRLTIEVNSARRAQRLRDQVEERLREPAGFPGGGPEAAPDLAALRARLGM